MSPTLAPSTVRFGTHEVAFPSARLQELRDANALLDDPVALRARLDEDGYLLIRGLHDPGAVLAARREILERVAAQGRLDPDAPLMEARIPAEGHGAFFGKTRNDDIKSAPAYQHLVRSPRLMRFFDQFFGTPSMTFDFQWLRLVGHGDFTGAHLDNVYMGRGTPRLLTTWTPVGDVGLDQGPLVIGIGSHRAESMRRVRETYGQMDVDRDRVKEGWFSRDPFEVADRHGVTWGTTTFRAGDALVFGMYTLHASLTNTSRTFRLSSDTRYQPANEPADERWVGDQPKGHYGWHSGEQVTIDTKRREWGV